MAGRYNFVSPGAMATDAISQVLMQRAAMQRQQQEDEFKRQQADIANKHAAAQLAFQQQQEARIAEAQQRAQEETVRQHESARAANIYQTQLPGVIDQSTLDLERKYGYQLPVKQGQPTQGAYQGDDESGIPQYDVIPGVLETTGGFQYQQAKAAQDAAAARAAADREAANQRAKEANDAKVEAAAAKASEDTAPALQPAALDMAAKMYAKTGTLPPMGMGKNGTTVRQAIINRASQYDQATDTFGGGGPAPDIASNKAGYSADTQGLSQLTKNITAVSAFEETAKKNGQLLESVLSKIPGQNTPRFLNTPLRGLASQFGSENMAQFNALRQSVQNEYARLVSQPGLSGVMSDSARKEMETILSDDATPGQIRAALQALYQEAENRKVSFNDQIGAIKGRIKGGAPAAQDSAPVQKWGRDAQGKPVRLQ